MSSSIIRPHSVNKDSLSQYNVQGHCNKKMKEGDNLKKALKMKQMIMNIEDEEPAEIEQLISMMRNHKVSDDTAGFRFHFGSDNKDIKPITPKTSPQPSKTSFTLPSKFRFSFTANVRSPTEQLGQEKNYIEVGDEYYEDDLDSIDDPVRKRETEMNTYYNQHIVSRKILPLPKPRWKRLLEKNKPAENEPRDIKKLKSSPSSSSSSSSSLPPPPIEHTTVDNKRKERNWNDSFTTADVPAEVTEVNTDFLVESKLRIPPNDTKNWEPIATPKIPPMHTPKKTAAKKKEQLKTSTSTVTNKTRKKNKKKTVKEDIAPGGFLSSDITLFGNPISDDWICLFCQYDILMHGLEDTKRKKGYYRRKKEKAKRLKEAELRRAGGQSDSEEDHEHHHHHQHHV